MILRNALLPLGLVLTLAAGANAQDDKQPQPPGVVVQGSTDVQVGDLPAARSGDATTSPGGVVSEGSGNVFINGRPAARLGDRTNCGVIVRGSGSVFINGKPMARVGDNTFELTVGCLANCDIMIDDVTVSNVHALMTKDARGYWYVQDVGSTTGTHVNEQDTDPTRPLQSGDKIAFGMVEVTFHLPASHYALVRRLI